MTNVRTAAAVLGATSLLAAPLSLVAAPAHADGPEKERSFRVAGADVDFHVEKEDGRFDVDVDVDDAKPGSKWRIVLRHDGKVFHNKVHRADSDGDIDVDKRRADTKGADVFKVTVKKVGGKSKSSTIRMR
ncbi:hypothetical protein [Nocardioides marmotae]|uniref:hypothetical protein n=1 Tax=Nocardioides marmotae TaxID=2663857 RepID=UPI0012B645AD|nr:hypothetical protein [Nocardioides marmotae]MBC9731827.1 hypothetical protein [Nocardioides marmotae]MTB82947.1 hypothetical protein [Nocardioides marmotae]